MLLSIFLKKVIIFKLLVPWLWIHQANCKSTSGAQKTNCSIIKDGIDSEGNADPITRIPTVLATKSNFVIYRGFQASLFRKCRLASTPIPVQRPENIRK